MKGFYSQPSVIKTMGKTQLHTNQLFPKNGHNYCEDEEEVQKTKRPFTE